MSHPTMVPLLVVDDVAATRRFYVDELACTPVIDQVGYLQVRFGDDPDTRELAFMAHDPPDGPMGGEPVFAGGLIVSVAVGDADKHRAVLAERGIDAPEATDKPWGWRSFMVRDPNSVVLDFFHEMPETADRPLP